MLFIILLITVLTYYLFIFYSRVRRLPPGIPFHCKKPYPGPLPLPLIGNFHQMTWGVYKHGGIIPFLQELHKQYGDVVTFFMGPLATVHIFDYQISVDAMVSNGTKFVDRNKIEYTEMVRELVFGGRGVIFANGQHWHEQRKFALNTLKRFGMGKNIMQDKIMDEFNRRANKLDEEINSGGGSVTIDPGRFVERTVGNIINRIILSHGFTEEKEEHFFQLKQKIDDAFEEGDFFDFIPEEATSWLSWLPFFQRRLKKFTEPLEALIQYMRDQIAERKNAIENGEHQPSEEGEDFVDAFLLQMKNGGAGDSFDEETLAVTMVDLWIGGQHTTAGSLHWALTYLLLHPEVVERMHKELDLVTQRKRQLLLSDRPKTPYFNAVIQEILRLSAIAPMNLFRVANEDTRIGGHFVPKGTAVTAQLSVIMSDPKVFAEPQKFKPERFLDSGLEKYVVPFGLGKRACLGEAAARTEIYLILGNLFLSYKLSINPDASPKMEAINESGDLRLPHQFTAIISKRT